MSFTPFSTSLVLQAATPVAGFALQNGTPTVISWTAPNDGKLHYVAVFAEIVVSNAETGGQITAILNDPAGGNHNREVIQGGQGAGFVGMDGGSQTFVIQAGSTFSIVQNTALTAGAATLWAGIWGS